MPQSLVLAKSYAGIPPELWKALSQVFDLLHRITSGQAGAAGPKQLAAPPLSLMLPEDSPTILEVVNEMLSIKAQRGCSQDYLYQLRHCYELLIRGKARRPLSSFTTRDLEKWLNDSAGSARTREGRTDYIKMLFKWAQRRGYIERDPAAAIEYPLPDRHGPDRTQIHSPDQVRALLDAAWKQHKGLARAVALRYFTGIRAVELQRLREDEEKDIHLEQRYIEIRAVISKTRSRRLITIQENLAAWLQATEPMPGDLEKRITKMWKAAGIEWLKNAPRHSFVSYHLAHFSDAAKTALQAGHDQAVLFSTYRELVTPESAAEFWAIVPPGQSQQSKDGRT